MAFKLTYIRRKNCLPLYILRVELSRFMSRREPRVQGGGGGARVLGPLIEIEKQKKKGHQSKF